MFQGASSSSCLACSRSSENICGRRERKARKGRERRRGLAVSELLTPWTESGLGRLPPPFSPTGRRHRWLPEPEHGFLRLAPCPLPLALPLNPSLRERRCYSLTQVGASGFATICTLLELLGSPSRNPVGCRHGSWRGRVTLSILTQVLLPHGGMSVKRLVLSRASSPFYPAQFVSEAQPLASRPPLYQDSTRWSRGL